MGKQLSFKHEFQYPVEDVYNVVKEQQLSFFQQYDHSIKELSKGIEIKKQMYTKTSNKEIPVKMCISELIDNQRMEVVTKYHEGVIVTTYLFENINGKTRMTYIEENGFNKAMNEMNFYFVSFLYKWMYNRNIKKRMRYIESLLGEVN